jgi:hypothetical protein
VFLLWGNREGIAEKTVTKEDQFYHHCCIIHSVILPGQNHFHYKTVAAFQCFCYGGNKEGIAEKTVTKENLFCCLLCIKFFKAARFVHMHSLLSNTQFIMQKNDKKFDY